MGKTLSIDKCPIGLVQSLEIQQHWSHDTIHIECILDRDYFPNLEEYISVQDFYEEARLKKQWDEDHKRKANKGGRDVQ